MSITLDDIRAAADSISERGVKPTLALVRRELGRGSYTTISEAMRDWRAQRAQAAPSPVDDVPDSVRDLARQQAEAAAQSIWTTAQDIAANQVEAERQALEQVRSRMEGESREGVEVADQLSAELAQTQQALASERQQRTAIDQEAMTLRTQAESAATRIQDLQGRLSAAESQRDSAKQQAHTAQAQTALLEARQTADTERRDQAETQVTTLRTDLETERVRREAADQRIRALETASKESEGIAQEVANLRINTARIEAELDAARRSRDQAEQYVEHLMAIIVRLDPEFIDAAQAWDEDQDAAVLEMAS